MKKIVKLILVISCFLPFMINVKAVCNDKDLNDFVEKLEVNFFEPTKPEDYAEGYLDLIGPYGNTEYFYYFILSEDKYKDKGIEETLELEAYDGDGRKGLWKYQRAIGKWGVGGYNGVEAEVYTLKIKAVSGTCKGELLKETTYRVPKYNKFTATEYCEFHPEHRLCASFTEETENMTDAEFGELMAEYVETLEPKKPGFKELLLKYYSYILCAILPAVIVAIYYRRKIKRLIKMKNQIIDGDRRIKKKKRLGIFILLFIVFANRVYAASECEITVQSDRRIATVETVRVSTTHCGWGGGGDYDISDSVMQNAVNEAMTPYAGYAFDPCSGQGGWSNKLQRCLTKGASDVETHGYDDKGFETTTTTTYSGGPGTCESGGSVVGSCSKCGYYKPVDEDGDGYADGTEWVEVAPVVGLDASKADGCNEATAKAQEQCDKYKTSTAVCKAAGGVIANCSGAPSCNISGKVKCPSHGCSRTNTFKDVTIDTYKIGTTSAYCVNPGLAYPTRANKEDIDASSCASSTSSVECGYANILVESSYYNAKHPSNPIDHTTIALAMRFWGAYTKQAGYSSTTGLGTYVGRGCDFDTTHNLHAEGDGFDVCEEMVFLDYDSNGNYKNVYKETVKKLLEQINKLSKNGDYDAIENVKIEEALTTFKGLTCDTDGSGGGTGDAVICNNEADGRNLKFAMALFYNTRNGNKDLKEHLNALYGNLSVKPISVSVSSQSTTVKGEISEKEEIISECEKDENGNCKVSTTVLNIEYGEEVTENSTTIDCAEENLQKLVDSGKITEEQRDMVRNYCTVEVHEIRVYHGNDYTEYTDNGYRECKYKGKDANDNAIYDCDPNITKVSGMIGKISACRKSTCAMTTKIYADCKMGVTGITAYVTYKDTPSAHAVKKYYACTAKNPNNGRTWLQNLYTIETNPPDPTYRNETITEYPVEISCASECEDLHIRRSNQACKTPVINEVKNYRSQKSYETSIQDPPLSCILNASIIDKATYDYSDYFGVNTDICRIYCSDSAHYYMADKMMVYNGLSLKYDIEYAAFKHNQSKAALDSIMEMRRDCVSEIYYDRLLNGKPQNYMANTYGLSGTYGSAGGVNIDTWRNLYNEVYKNATRDNKRNEQLTQLIYDLYNCNLFKEKDIKKQVPKPKDNTIGSIYDNTIKKLYEATNNYGFEDCELSNETNTCMTLEGISYDNGARYAADSKGGSGKKVGDTRDTIIYDYTLELNPDTATITGPYYCKGVGCFDYLAKHIQTGTECSYATRNGLKYSDNDLCDIKQGSYVLPVQRMKDDKLKSNIEYADATGTFDTVSYYDNEKKSVTRSVPKNDYAYFTVSTKVGFFNVSSFQAQRYTGDVYDVTKETTKWGKDRKTTYYDKPIDTRVNITKGVYPVNVVQDSYADYNNLVLDSNGKQTTVGKNYYKYQIRNHMGETGTYFRNFGKNSSFSKPKLLDKFYGTLNNDESTTFTCWYINKYIFDEDPQVAYRNIELTNFFPVNRTIGKNWNTEEAQKYVNETEHYVDQNGTLKYYDSHLEYSYTLTQSTLKKLREYNANNKKYTDPNQDDESGKIINNKYYGIKSTFLDDIDKKQGAAEALKIINNKQEDTIKYGIYIRGKSKYTIEKEEQEEMEKTKGGKN